jgi:hypothetical protein
VASGGFHELHRRELRRFVVEDPAGRGIPDRDLERHEYGADGERDEETQTVVSVALTAQHRRRVDATDQEPSHDVRG